MAIRREFPQYAPWFSIEGLAVGKKAIPNYNLLVGRYEGADGMKTGFVCPSGFNMIGAATRNGRSFVAVVLGQSSAVKRTDMVADLLDRGFQSTGGQKVTLPTLAAYGAAGKQTDMREEICHRKAAQVQSEDAGDVVKAQPSPWVAKIPNP